MYKLFRIGEWLDSKISFYYFSLLYIILCSKVPLNKETFIYTLLCVMFYVCFIGASYLVNDLSDIEVDKKSGKQKMIADMDKRFVIVIIILTIVVGVVPLLIYERSVGFIISAVLIYTFGFAYSLKPFRLKEKGLFGVVFCSVAQKCIPVALVLLHSYDKVATALILALNFFIGLRYILIHQLIDRENDEKSDVSTFSRSHSKTAVVLLYTNVLLEIGLLVVCDVYLAWLGYITMCVVMSVVLAVYMLIVLIYMRAVKYMLNERIFETFSFVPLEAFYSALLPLLISISAIKFSWLWCICIAALLCIQARMIYVRIDFITIFFKSLGKNNQPKRETDYDQ